MAGPQRFTDGWPGLEAQPKPRYSLNCSYSSNRFGFSEVGKLVMHYRSRVQRPRAYNEPGHAHELTFSCFQRFAFLSKDRTCQWLADAIRHATIELNYSLWAYVFMPDHVHLIVYPQQNVYDDAKLLSRVKEPVSRKAIQFLKSEAPDWLPHIAVQKGRKLEHHFWQPGRGYDRNVIEAETLMKMIDYLHLNPVRKGLVERSRDWKWSSTGWFEAQPLNNLKPDTIPPQWLAS
jgi:putative transposase